MRRILRYRWRSGSDGTPDHRTTEHDDAATTTDGRDTHCFHVRIPFTRAVRPRRVRSTGSGRTTRAGRRPGRPRGRRRRAGRRRRLVHRRDRAILSAKNRSWASARRDGCSRTRLPRLTRTPFTSTASMSGCTALSANGSHQSTPSGISGISPESSWTGVRIAQHAVQVQHRLRRHRVAAVDDLGGPRVGGARLPPSPRRSSSSPAA